MDRENWPDEEVVRATWFTPHDALEHLQTKLDSSTARRTIIGRLQSEIIRSFALTCVIYQAGREKERHGLYYVRPHLWLSNPQTDPMWANGDIVFQQSAYGVSEATVYKYFDVRFEPDSIFALAPRIAVSGTATAAPEHRASAPSSGRPPKPFWENLIIEIGRQLYSGELIPARQADIERAMNEWLEQNGHEVSDKPVRDRARKVWQAIGKG